MKKLILLGFAFGMICTANAQTTKNYDTAGEMNEQMRVIVNKLGLDTQKVYELGQIMNQKKLQKEKLLMQIESLKSQMNDLEANSEKQIQGLLTEEQWQKYQTELKPEIEAVTEEHMKQIDK